MAHNCVYKTLNYDKKDHVWCYYGTVINDKLQQRQQ